MPAGDVWTVGLDVGGTKIAGGLVRHEVLKAARGWAQASDHVPAMVEIAP